MQSPYAIALELKDRKNEKKMFLRGLKITTGNDQERADSSKHKLFDITKTELPEPKGGRLAERSISCFFRRHQ